MLIFGGFDTADMPEIGYGSQRGGARRRLVSTTANLATRLITNSNYTLQEIERNVAGVDAGRVAVVYHGIPDRFGEPDGAPRGAPGADGGRRLHAQPGPQGPPAVRRRGRGMPDVEFVLAGEWWDETGERLAAAAAPNVRVTAALGRRTSTRSFARPPSTCSPRCHEGFGLSLAEAMLAGACRW